MCVPTPALPARASRPPFPHRGLCAHTAEAHFAVSLRTSQGATSFNQQLDWNTAAVTSMNMLFSRATSFNQALNWDVAQVTYMYSLFNGATSFNQPLPWNVAHLTSLDNLFNVGGPHCARPAQQCHTTRWTTAHHVGSHLR